MGGTDAREREDQDSGRVTRALQRAAGGDVDARAELVDLVYEELRRIARAQVAGQRRRVTLQPTMLVHEAYLRLLQPAGAAFDDRRHFYRAAAQAMRSILVDMARARTAAKRTPSETLVRLESDGRDDAVSRAFDVIAVHEALARLEEIDPDACRVVELRYFAGLGVEETAAILDITSRTVRRTWQRARAWLFHELSR